MSPVSLPDQVRDACAWVAGRAQSVRIEAGAIESYADGLTRDRDPVSPPEARRDPEAAAAFAICMNAINFGSGWWPTIRKRPGLSGYATMAAGVEERFDAKGRWSAEELAAMDAPTIAAALGQEPGHPLMAQFAAALRDVGAHLHRDHDGRFLGVAEAANSIPALAGILAAWESFADTSSYEGQAVPFFKRAQLAAADLHRAGLADLPGIDSLTAFADNLVPHVLRLDGILHLDPDLTARIEAGDLLTHGSPGEVELRACAVHAIELLAAATGGSLTPAEIDGTLWNRGRARRYKSLPRPRSRNTAY
jgi:Queuosine salvage protein